MKIKKVYSFLRISLSVISILIDLASCQNSCYLELQGYGLDVGTYTSDVTLLANSKDITIYHQISSIRYCEGSATSTIPGSISSLQATLSAYWNKKWQDPIILNLIGKPPTPNDDICDIWNINPGEYVSEISVSFDLSDKVTPIKRIGFMSKNGQWMVIGAFKGTQTQVWKFDMTNQPKGFFNFYDTSIKKFGLVSASTSCDPNPGKVPPNKPDAPVSLQNDATTTNDKLIRFTWSQGALNGGAPILDYTIYYDQGQDTIYVLLARNVSTNYYTTSNPLISGKTYKFKVTARNIIGESDQSTAVAILAARVPDAPESLQDNKALTTAYQIGLTWSAGNYNGASPVIDYQISYAERLSTTFTIFASGLTATSTTVTNLQPGQYYKFVVQSRNVVGFSPYSYFVIILAAQVPNAPTGLANVPEITSAKQIGLTWSTPNFNGGSQILDYSIWFDNSSGTTFTKLVDGISQISYSTTSITQGNIYQFRVQARNRYGFSVFSQTISVLAAQQPSQPSPPTTAWSSNNIIIQWEAPDNGGSSIIGYIVTIRQSDETTFSTDLTHCNMQNQTATTCKIPVKSLQLSPFTLEWGMGVYAKVVAINQYGKSLVSDQGNGDIMKILPDQPFNLQEATQQRTKSTLGLKWSQAAQIGSAAIIDYRVSFATIGEDFSVLASNVFSLQYTANNLIAGLNYQFKIESRNQYGYSAYSDSITLLCAFKPEVPTIVTTINFGNQVIIKWSEAFENGSPIISYKIFIQQHDSTVYTQETVECDGNSAAVIANRICKISLSTLRQSPYLLMKDDKIKVKIISTNFYGESEGYSDEGDGALIQLVPDAPLSLYEDEQISSDTVIRFTWSQGISNGGSPVLDYDVYYDQGINFYILLKSNVIENYYTTQVSLVKGKTYSFYVTARNSVGSSNQSAIIQILAAKPADAPLRIFNDYSITNAQQVGITWSVGAYDGGSPVIDYQISYSIDPSDLYQVFKSGIENTFVTVTGLTPGVTYRFVVRSRNIEGFSDYSQYIKVLAAQAPDAPTSLNNDASITAASQVGLLWQPPLFDGGSPITDYSIWFNQGQGSIFIQLTNEITALSYTATSLTQGLNYQFKVKARNAYGFSIFSSTISVLTAQKPARPSAPVTIWNPENVIIQWIAPDNGGSPITGYKVEIKQSDQIFTTDLVNCEMQTSTDTTCKIPVISLRSSPFSLDWGASVLAKVVATNLYGDSLISDEGNGAIITTQPDSPINLTEDSTQRTKSTLGLIWSQAAFTGGSDIIDYRISIAQADDLFTVLTSNVVSQKYTAINLTAGLNYKFKIQSRNSYGYSAFSESITLFCAFRPDAPSTVSSANSGKKVTIKWSLPVENGSPITAYKIFIKQYGSTDFMQESVECDGNNQDVVAKRFCDISLSTLRSQPFSLHWGASVYSKVIALNFYGGSSLSDEGNGAIIFTTPDAPIDLIEIPSQRTKSILGFKWSQAEFTGGTEIIDYRVSIAQVGEVFTVLDQNVVSPSYTAIGLSAGLNYQFKIESRNSQGYSDYSDSITLLCAYQPEAPETVTTQNTGNHVTIKWSDPIDNGSPITAYKIFIQGQGSTDFTQETEECDGNSPAVIQNRICSISLITLRSSPYSLIKGDKINAKIKSTNFYGDSVVYSDVGNGALIQLVPDAPILSEDQAISSDTVIRLTWSQGVQNGGSPVLDYDVYYDQGISDDVLLAQGVIDNYYTTQVVLIPGKTYSFKVTARNSVGSSNQSAAFSILAAKPADAPLRIFNDLSVTNAYQVGLTWSVGAYDGGSPVLDYQISYSVDPSDTYQVQQSGVKNTFATVTGLTPGVTYRFVIQSRNVEGLSGYSEYIKVLAAQVPDAPVSLANDASKTSASQVGLTWRAPFFDGGLPITDYSIWYNQGDGSTFIQLTSEITTLSYTVASLNKGLTYQFKVMARNSYGFSVFSDSISILTAQKPAQPSAPITTWAPDDVVISWLAPDNGGSAITGYKVTVRQSDATFTTDLVHCDMQQTSTVTKCTIPVTALRSSPFSLEWGASVFAKVVATNLYGDSLASDQGSGAVITTKPDAPISLAEEISQRTKSTLGIKWAQAAFTGGTEIIDYRVSIAQDDGVFAILTYHVVSPTYTAIGLMAGRYYQFKVESRNSFGYSDLSDSITLLCAFKPDAPATVTTVNSGNQVTIKWSAPVENGSPITAYKIFIQQHGSTDFTLETVECDGNSAAVVANRICSVSLNNLRSSPYSLVRGESINAKIISTNFYGDSILYSDVGNGAIMQYVPDAPINVANDPSESTDTAIRINWNQGTSDGDSTVQDFNVYYDQGSDDFVILAQFVQNSFYTTTVQLKTGVIYKFKVTARNSVGNSDFSTAVAILAAKIPDAPISLQDNLEMTNGYQIGLTWSTGLYDGGSPVIDYQVSFALQQSQTYTIFASGILTLSSIVKGLTPGQTYRFVVQSRNVVGFSPQSQSVTILAAQIPDQPISLSNAHQVTCGSRIGITWQEPRFNGGSQIIDYLVFSDLAKGQNFVVLAQGLTQLNYNITNLTQGLNYLFKVQARNAYGKSLFSDTISILTAQTPAQPSEPVTAWIPNNVVISWTAPDNGGNQITGYIVTIKQSDTTFTTDLVHCDMQSTTDTTCKIPVSTLQSPPFSLQWGTSVYAKVVAKNQYGNSLESDEGNGAIITTNPDAPTNLSEDKTQRTKSTLGLKWSQATFTGGTVIKDYRINIARADGVFSVLASNVVSTSYTAINLNAGINYQFKVQSRNSYGYSDFSDSITLLCAFKPEAPVTVTTINSGDSVTIKWSQPIDNGSPIIAYKIFIQQHESLDYTQEQVECNGNNATLIANRICSISLKTLSSSPYSLARGASIYARIISTNLYGDSILFSNPGNGAKIQLVPDAPTNLVNDPSKTTDTTIGLTWSQGASNGGSTVQDFNIYFNDGQNDFVLLVEGVTTQYYKTSSSLKPGQTYNFKITARNSIGNSDYSTAVTILAAKIPDAPISLIDIVDPTNIYQIGLIWSQGLYDGGSPVIDYQVSYAQEQNSSYQIFSSGIQIKFCTLTDLKPNITYRFAVKSRNVVGFSDYSQPLIIKIEQIDQIQDIKDIQVEETSLPLEYVQNYVMMTNNTKVLVTKSESDQNPIYYIIGGVIGGLVIIAIIVAIYCCNKKQKLDDRMSIEINPTEEQIITETVVNMNEIRQEPMTQGWDKDDEVPQLNLRRHDSGLPLSEESISGYYKEIPTIFLRSFILQLGGTPRIYTNQGGSGLNSGFKLELVNQKIQRVSTRAATFVQPPNAITSTGRPTFNQPQDDSFEVSVVNEVSIFKDEEESSDRVVYSDNNTSMVPPNVFQTHLEDQTD